MKLTISHLAVILISLLVPTVGLGAEQKTLECATGPVDKSYGGTNWLVYSCNDDQSIVIVSGPGNPAGPYYFMLYPKAGTYALKGEGNGSKAASAAAYHDLEKLSETEISKLITETKSN